LGGCATNTNTDTDISLSPPFASADAVADAADGIIPAMSSTVPPGFVEVVILGAVNHPGGYLLPEDTPKTVLDLVTVAGPNELSILSRVKLRRRAGDGKTLEISINLKVKIRRRFHRSQRQPRAPTQG
jgi:hypothetical protein